MSQWTHVAGIIRIDSLVDLLGGPDTTERMLRDRLGYTWDYDDLGNRAREIHIDNSHVPCGSEGSVQYKIVKTRPETGSGEHSLSWGHIAIYGDLRDFDDPNEIYNWLGNALVDVNKDGISIRDIIVSIVVEYSNQYIIFQDEDDQGNTEIRMSVSQVESDQNE